MSRVLNGYIIRTKSDPVGDMLRKGWANLYVYFELGKAQSELSNYGDGARIVPVQIVVSDHCVEKA